LFTSGHRRGRSIMNWFALTSNLSLERTEYLRCSTDGRAERRSRLET
jgi:hypothetical protein